MRARCLWPLVDAGIMMVSVAMPRGQQPGVEALLIKTGRLLDVRGSVYRTAQDLWIEGGRIRRVGAFDEVRSRGFAICPMSRS
jgi:hypothetical protein